MRTLAGVLAVMALATAPGRGLRAQWGIAADVGVARFGGSSRDTSGTTVGPYRPTTFEVRVDRQLDATRVAIALMYAHTGIAGERGGLAVVQYDVASLWEIAPEVSLRVARFGTGVEARVAAGPAIDFWNFDGEQRTRVGGRAAAIVEWPLARALKGSLRVSGAVSESVFDAADAPSGVERRATRRLGVALGLRYQL